MPMHSTERQPSCQASAGRPSATQLTVDRSAAAASSAQKQCSSRSLACRTDYQSSRSPVSASPRTPTSPNLSRPPWNSSLQVSEGSSPRSLVNSYSSKSSSKHTMSAEEPMNGSTAHDGGLKHIRANSSQAKRPHLTDALPGTEQVFGLLSEYITPDNTKQQQKQSEQLNQHTASLPSTEPVPVPSLPREMLPPVGVSSELTAAHLSVLGAWYCLYCPEKEAQQVAALAKHYDAKAGFEDNFVQAFGRDQLGVQFYGMRRLVKGISLEIKKVEVLVDTGKHSPDTYQLRIISRILFYLPALIRGPVTSLVLPPAVEAWATDTLTVRQSDNIVVHHQQRVHNIPTFPWPIRAYAGLTSSLFMMHILGW